MPNRLIFLLLLMSFSITIAMLEVFDIAYCEFGDNIGAHVKNRILKHLSSLQSLKVFQSNYNSVITSPHRSINSRVMLAFGNTETASQFIESTELYNAEREGFVIKEFWFDEHTYVMIGNGNPLDDTIH